VIPNADYKTIAMPLNLLPHPFQPFILLFLYDYYPGLVFSRRHFNYFVLSAINGEKEEEFFERNLQGWYIQPSSSVLNPTPGFPGSPHDLQ